MADTEVGSRSTSTASKSSFCADFLRSDVLSGAERDYKGVLGGIFKYFILV